MCHPNCRGFTRSGHQPGDDRLDRIREWAKLQPESAWTPGYPLPIDGEYALKTESGGIASGELFLWDLPPVRFGPNREKVIAYILVDPETDLTVART
jgi:hypothetical protein